MQPSPSEAERMLAEACATFNGQLTDAIREWAQPPIRYGWKSSVISHDLIDYILKRASILRAIHDVQSIGPSDLAAHTKATALKIRENALHALATLARAMAASEEANLSASSRETNHPDYIETPTNYPNFK